MATNKLPPKRDALFALAESMSDALHVDEIRLGVKQNTEACLRAEFAAAIEARNTYNRALTAGADLSQALVAADCTARAFIFDSRSVLRHFLGKPWTPAWQATGFPNNSVAMPQTVMERLVLVGALGNYFQLQPEKQNEALNVTSIHAGEVFKALQDARTAVGNNDSAAEEALIASRKSEQALRWRMSGLIAELRQLLDDDDPVWFRFGLNRPSDPEIPVVPGQLVVTGGLPGSIHVKWAPARRAERYRIYKIAEDEYVPIATTADPFATFTGLQSGETLTIVVSAANGAGESQSSDPVQIVVPAELVSILQA